MKIELMALLFLTMLSCGQQRYDKENTFNSQSQKNTANTIQNNFDSTKNDRKAIGNINFYTSKPIADGEIRKFNADNKGNGVFGIGYYIGDFKYISVVPSFHNDSLYELTITGSEIANRSVAGILDVQFTSITGMLHKKFGEPTHSDDYSQTWVLGNKTINVSSYPIYEVGSNEALSLKGKKVNVRIYLTDLANRESDKRQYDARQYDDSVVNYIF